MKFVVPLFLFSFCALAQNHGPLDLPRCEKELKWVASQNEKSRKLLASSPEIQNQIKQRGSEIIPQNPLLKTNYGTLEFYVSGGSLRLNDKTDNTDRVIVDVSTLPEGSSVTEFRLSPDQKKVAYGFSKNGTDWQTWKVIELESLRDLAGPFYIKNSSLDVMNWDLDSQGLFYPNSVYASEDAKGVRDIKIKYHKLGTALSSDPVLFKSKEDFQIARLSAQPFNDEYFIVHRVLGVAEVPMAIYLVSKKTGQYKEVIPAFKYWGRLVGLSKNEVYVRLSSVGSRYGVIAVDPLTLKQRVVIPERENEVLLQAQLIGDKFYLQYLDEKLGNIIRFYSLSGELIREVRPSALGMPNRGSLSLFTGGVTSKVSYFTYSAIEAPTETYKINTETLLIEKLPSKKIPFDGSKIKSETKYYKSRDGTLIPIQIYSRSDITADPEFAYLYIYGNIGIVNLSQFNRKFQLMLELGGIVALAGVRGGGEFGLDWQKAGTLERTKTVEDISYASKWLKKNFRLKEERVVLSGRSFGGMMTMAAYTYFQNDFSLFTPVVPVSDTWDYLNKLGWWAYDDLGFTRNNKGQIIIDYESLKKLSRWSPAWGIRKLLNIKPIMSFSQRDDTRTSPEQSVKFIKNLQDRFGEESPLYLIEYEVGGHNARSEIVDEATFIAIFFGIQKLNPLKQVAK